MKNKMILNLKKHAKGAVNYTEKVIIKMNQNQQVFDESLKNAYERQNKKGGKLLK